jgi:hypothetical protein
MLNTDKCIGLKFQTLKKCSKCSKIEECFALVENAMEIIEYRDGLPVFVVIPVEDTEYGVFFRCPVCKRLIMHSRGTEEKASGHRVEHCKCWKNGYYIKEI